MKHYKAIFFDWDGTAVLSRTAPADEAATAMKPLLASGVKRCIISGTTYENIAGGKLHELFTPEERQNLFLGLARGAQGWGFGADGKRVLLGGLQPDRAAMAAVHTVSFDVHQELFLKYGFNTDIMFSRPNYCKIDLLPGAPRGEQLFFQVSEAEHLKEELELHGFSDGLRGLISLAEGLGEKHGFAVKATTDAKYLEVGLSTKSENVDFLMDYLKLSGQIAASGATSSSILETACSAAMRR